MTPDDALPVVSVVVPMLDAESTIADLLTSVDQQAFAGRWELVLVDNGSDDDTVGAVKRSIDSAASPEVRSALLVEMDAPKGHASPRNRGAEVARGDILVFCDADDALAPGFLEAIVAAARSSHLAASVQQTVAHRDFSTIPAAPRPEPELPTTLGFPVARTCGMAVSRALFEELGGFDPYFDRGGADADFSIRAKTSTGIEPVLAKDALMLVGPRETAGSSFRQGYRYGRSQTRLFERHLAHHDAGRTGPATTVRTLLKLAGRLLRTRSRRRRNALSRSAGATLARAVWSVRLRVRSF